MKYTFTIKKVNRAFSFLLVVIATFIVSCSEPSLDRDLAIEAKQMLHFDSLEEFFEERKRINTLSDSDYRDFIKSNEINTFYDDYILAQKEISNLKSFEGFENFKNTTNLNIQFSHKSDDMSINALFSDKFGMHNIKVFNKNLMVSLASDYLILEGNNLFKIPKEKYLEKDFDLKKDELYTDFLIGNFININPNNSNAKTPDWPILSECESKQNPRGTFCRERRLNGYVSNPKVEVIYDFFTDPGFVNVNICSFHIVKSESYRRASPFWLLDTGDHQISGDTSYSFQYNLFEGEELLISLDFSQSIIYDDSAIHWSLSLSNEEEHGTFPVQYENLRNLRANIIDGFVGFNITHNYTKDLSGNCDDIDISCTNFL